MRVLKNLAAAALLLCTGPALADPSPSLITTSQVTCTSSIGVLVAAQPGLLHTVTIENGGAVAFYIGGAAVATSTGFLIPGVQYSSYTISYAGTLYCVTASSTATVYVLETTKGG